jgi:uncharacterized protein (TIGR03067 family)
MKTSHRSAATASKLFASVGVWCAVVAMLTELTAVQASDMAAAPDDRADSVGHWTVISVEWDGKPVDPELLAMLGVDYRADGSWSVLFKKLPIAQGTSTSNQDRSPKTFEMVTHGSEGVMPSRYTGIYRLHGDTRVLCMVREGRPRPTEFSAPKRSGRMLVTLKRSGNP